MELVVKLDISCGRHIVSILQKKIVNAYFSHVYYDTEYQDHTLNIALVFLPHQKFKRSSFSVLIIWYVEIKIRK
jgi:hypothetical protein